MRIAVVLNPAGGTLRDGDAEAIAAEIRDAIAAHGHDCEVFQVSGGELAATFRRVAASHDAVVAGGGDGTVSAAAAVLAGSGVPMGVLPLGTMNLYARVLGLPLEPAAAARALATAQPREVDVAEVGGQPFLHHLTLGLHPAIVAGRERLRYRSRLDKMVKAVRLWWRLIRRARRLALRVAVDGEAEVVKASAILVSNNALAENAGPLPLAADPAGGELAVYTARSRSWPELVRMSVSAALGRWDNNAEMTMRLGRRVVIEGRRRSVRASLDGEAVRLALPLDIVIRPRALIVLAPHEAAAESGVGSAG